MALPKYWNLVFKWRVSGYPSWCTSCREGKPRQTIPVPTGPTLCFQHAFEEFNRIKNELSKLYDRQAMYEFALHELAAVIGTSTYHVPRRSGVGNIANVPAIPIRRNQRNLMHEEIKNILASAEPAPPLDPSMPYTQLLKELDARDQNIQRQIDPETGQPLMTDEEVRLMEEEQRRNPEGLDLIDET